MLGSRPRRSRAPRTTRSRGRSGRSFSISTRYGHHHATKSANRGRKDCTRLLLRVHERAARTQRRMGGTLKTFLDLDAFGPSVVKNALFTINNLAPQFPVTLDAHDALKEGLRHLRDQCCDVTSETDDDAERETAKPGLEDIEMQRGITLHNLKTFWDPVTGQQAAGTPGPMEEGEVGEERARGDEAAGKRRRGAGDELADARPTVRPRSGNNGQRGAPARNYGAQPSGRGR